MKRTTQATVRMMVKAASVLCGIPATVKFRDGEAIVVVDGNHAGSYHTNCYDDAIETACDMLRRAQLAKEGV